MIYGYDEAQLFPVQSLYDTGMINMYVNAMQRDYERGVAEQKEFLSKYGDFLTPFAKDAKAWDDLTVGAYRQKMNELQARGIDPIRSQEGRAELSKFIYSVPYAKLNQLKQSAEVGADYQKAYAALAAQGKISPDMAKQMDGDFQNWDTLGGNGVWGTAAPIEYKSYTDMLQPMINNLKNQYGLIGKDGFEDIYGVTDDRIKQVLTEGMGDLLATPQMQYYLNHDFGGDEEALKESLFGQVRGSLGDERKKNEIRWDMYKMQNDNRQHALDRAAKYGSQDPTSMNAYDYRQGNLNSAFALRGFGYGQAPNGTVIMPQQYEAISARSYALGKIGNTVVTLSDGKRKKLKDLKVENQQKVISQNPDLINKVSLYEDEFRKNHQLDIINAAMGSGRIKYHSQSSLALAYPDDPKQWKEHEHAVAYKGDVEGAQGFDAAAMGKNDFFTLEEVSARRGDRKYSQGVRKFKNGDDVRKRIVSFEPAGNGGREMITQYETHSGEYVNYRYGIAYLKDDDGNVSTKYVWKKTYPNEMSSTMASGGAQRSRKATGVNNKAVPDTLDDNIQNEN